MRILILGDPLVVYTEIYIEDLNSFKPVTMVRETYFTS